jgi:NAD(P)-dependent dehydrogenase (short-subunit alcohol dehydrogenase family)
VASVDLDAAAAERAAAQVHDARALGLAADVVANAGITSRVATFRAISSESFERVLNVLLSTESGRLDDRARRAPFGRQGGADADNLITTALRGVSERVPTLS